MIIYSQYKADMIMIHFEFILSFWHLNLKYKKKNNLFRINL